MTTVRPASVTQPSVKAPVRAQATPQVEAPRTPRPTGVRLSALEQMRAEKPSFKTPDEYKNYVIKFAGYIQAAKADLAAAQKVLDGEKAKEAEASAEHIKPLNAAKKVLDDTHELYQEPVDRFSAQLKDAKVALDDAIYPGKRRAQELDAQAAALQGQINALDSDLDDARARLASLETMTSREFSRRSGAESSRSQAESDIRRLEFQAPSDSALTAQRARVGDASARLNAANSRYATAKAASDRKQRLETGVSTLQSVASQYDSAENSRSAYKSWVTRRKEDLDAAMSDGTPDEITAAKSKYDEAVANYNAADQRVKTMESQMSAYGASPANVDSVIAAMKSELAGLTGAASELSSATSARQSAQSAYDTEKRKLTDMEALANALDDAYARRNEAIRVINDASARLSAYASEKSQLNREIPQLQEELRIKTGQHRDLVAEANRLRALQNPPTHPAVVSAKQRVDDLTQELNAAQATYNEKIAAPKAKVDAEQKVYNDKMAPYRAKVADAQRGVEAANKVVGEVKSEFEALKDVGFFRSFWWKIRYRFDVKEFWQTQNGQVASVQRTVATA